MVVVPLMLHGELRAGEGTGAVAPGSSRFHGPTGVAEGQRRGVVSRMCIQAHSSADHGICPQCGHRSARRFFAVTRTVQQRSPSSSRG
jgi:hypothetical protein